jgi:hypothetical protein
VRAHPYAILLSWLVELGFSPVLSDKLLRASCGDFALVRRHITSINDDSFLSATPLPELPASVYRRLANPLRLDGSGFGCAGVENYGNVVYSVADLRRFADRDRREMRPAVDELRAIGFQDAEKALRFRRGDFHLAHLTLVELGKDVGRFRSASLLCDQLAPDSLLRSHFCDEMLKVASQEYRFGFFVNERDRIYYSCEDIRDFLDHHPERFQKDGQSGLRIPSAAFHVFKVLCVLERDEMICRQVFLLHRCNFLRARAMLRVIDSLRVQFAGAKILMQCPKRRKVFAHLPREQTIRMTVADVGFAESHGKKYVFTGLDVYDMDRQWPDARVAVPDWCWSVEASGAPFHKVFADARLVAQLVE